MLKASLIEVLLRGIPESLILAWGIYVLCSKKIDINLYLFTSFLVVISMFFIRLLPIAYGVHTSLGIIMIIIITSFVNNIPVIKAISSTLILMILLSICEWLNIVILENLFMINLQKAFSIPLQKNLCGIPSLILLALIIYVIQIYVNKRNKLS